MHRDTLINKIKRDISLKFGTQRAAAEHFGITENHLSRVLNSDEAVIPDSMLDFVGYRKQTTITYIRNN